ncbi:MAG: error-prone DNA polymerase, partial [Pirellulaceae bacterium]
MRWSDLAADLSSGWLAGILLRSVGDREQTAVWSQWLGRFRELFGDRAYALSHCHLGVDDRSMLAWQAQLANDAKLPLVATGDVLYHTPERMLIHDLLTAIRRGQTIEDIAAERPPNAQHALRSVPQLQRLYRDFPEALERTYEVAQRCRFSLTELRYEYPVEAAPAGMQPIDFLKQLTWEGAHRRYPQEVPAKIVQL